MLIARTQTASPPSGLRERKKAATRQALSLAALRLAVERGLDHVLVEDIAAEVDVSPRTFNNYFGSKYEAICGLAVDRAMRIGAELRKRSADEPLWEAVTHAVVQQYAGADEKSDKEWRRGVRLVTSAPELRGEYLKAQSAMQMALAEAITERTAADEGDLSPRIMAAAVTAASEVALDHWLHAKKDVALVPLLKLAFRQLAHGFSDTAKKTQRR